MNHLSTRHWTSLGLLLALGTAPLTAGRLVEVSNASELVNALQNVLEGDVIELQSGTYVSPSHADLQLAGFRIINPGARFTVRAASAGSAILDGQSARPIVQYRVDNASLRGWITFEGIVFRNGFSNLPGTAGGVTISNGRATFVDCTFLDNDMDPGVDNGGAGGIGVFNRSVAAFDGTDWIGNTARNEGAGLQIGDGSRGFVHDAVFTDNRVDLPGHRNSAAGGGIHIGNSSPGVTTTVHVSNSRFEQNGAGLAGGAIFSIAGWDSGGTGVVVVNSTFVDNWAVSDPSVVPAFPTEGGAIHTENLTSLAVHNSRFARNRAERGGAVSLYRSEVTVDNSTFRGNYTTGRTSEVWWGGTFKAGSNDTVVDGGTNRRAASLTLRDSLVQGRFGAVGAVAQLGGGILVSGDTNRRYGLRGVSQAGTAAQNRASLLVERVAFLDLDLEQTVPTKGMNGGAISGALVDATIRDSIVFGCNVPAGAMPFHSFGGGAMFSTESDVTFERVTFADNTAEDEGGGARLSGSHITVTDSQFVRNEVSPVTGTFPTRGGALYVTSEVSPVATGLPATGVVSGSVFKDNLDLHIFDDDRDLNNPGRYNDTRYNDNTFWGTLGGDVFQNPLAGGPVDPAGLNVMIVDRDSTTPGNCTPGSLPECTDKSQTANSLAGNEPIVGALLGVPAVKIGAVAAGDPESSTRAYLAFVWDAGCAELDGAPLDPVDPIVETTFLLEATTGPHELQVFSTAGCSGASTTHPDTVSGGTVPDATLSADPLAISSGETSDLTRNATGSYLTGELVPDLGPAATPSGTTGVMPGETTTYRFFSVSKEGGAVGEATVFVDEPPSSLIFADGFESGDTSAWAP